MAWQSEMTTIVRFLINDIDATTYTDGRIQQAICLAAQLTKEDVRFPNDYTVSVSGVTISPDPTDGTRDNAFVNLVSLKTACLIDQWSFRVKAATAGVRIKSGVDEVDTKGQLDGYKALIKDGICAEYAKAKWEYEAGNLTPGLAILGPFAGDNVDTSYGGGLY